MSSSHNPRQILSNRDVNLAGSILPPTRCCCILHTGPLIAAVIHLQSKQSRHHLLTPSSSRRRVSNLPAAAPPPPAFSTSRGEDQDWESHATCWIVLTSQHEARRGSDLQLLDAPLASGSLEASSALLSFSFFLFFFSCLTTEPQLHDLCCLLL